MLSKSSIAELLRTNDKAVCRALVVLHSYQTSSEQAIGVTVVQNGKGFRPCDAFVGTKMAEFYKRNGYLTEKQIAHWRKTERSGKMRIEVYAGQLLEAAKIKQSKKESGVG